MVEGTPDDIFEIATPHGHEPSGFLYLAILYGKEIGAAEGKAKELADLVRAARILAIRSRRETTGLFAGGYASAFRGGGIEFEESRPYVPGDDVRSIDWNATARNGEPYVKRFREERDRTVLLALDVSASMRFGSAGRAMAATAAHALALLAAASGRAGDRVGFFAFGAKVRVEVPVGRGVSHGFRVVREALRAASTSGGETSLAAAIARISAYTRHRCVAIVFSDFRGREQEGHDSQIRGIDELLDLGACLSLPSDVHLGERQGDCRRDRRVQSQLTLIDLVECV